MWTVSSVAQSGMQAAQARLTAAASNVANQSTPGYRPVQAQLSPQAQPGGGVVVQWSRASEASGVALEGELVGQLQAKGAFVANVQVLKAADRMLGSLLDERA